MLGSEFTEPRSAPDLFAFRMVDMYLAVTKDEANSTFRTLDSGL